MEDLFNSENLDLESVEQKIYESASNEEIVELNINDLFIINSVVLSDASFAILFAVSPKAQHSANVGLFQLPVTVNSL